MEGKKGEHHYTECGLTSVYLRDVMIYRCTNCSVVEPEIPAAGILHRVIALRLAKKKNLLTGGEVRFLRKFCGYSATEFAEILGSSTSVVSRWEKNGCGKETDRFIRMLFLTNMIREIVGQPAPLLKNVTVTQLVGEIDNTLKLIEGKEKTQDRLDISPDDISRLAGMPEEVGELVPNIQ
ncbi:MAG: hypothetical protein ACYCOR_14755 [Acidobacteriaceae bacterium]